MMNSKRIKRSAVALCLLVSVSACVPASDGDVEYDAKDVSVNALKTMAESGVYETLGTPGTVAEILMNSPDITKTALIVHFKKKRDEAGMDLDFDQAEWYDVNIQCLSGDCTNFKKMQAARAAAKADLSGGGDGGGH